MAHWQEPGHTHVQHHRDFVLQKYVLLQEQHEFLRQQLDALRPLSTTTSPTTTSSPSLSPTQSSPWQSRSSSFSAPCDRRGGWRRSSTPTDLPTIPDDDETTAVSEVAAEERKLLDVTEGMKRALTELLNCESTRGDGARAFRTWVQCRLMDTERELRSGRRRRSAPSA